ncbi:MAG TPA: hypothetical protein VMS17_26240 [Gemmataceae bacterium]|nr:hypothetical protein [Gemmataceae bacterium]
MAQSAREIAYLKAARTRLGELSQYLNTINLTEESDVSAWFATLARIKEVQGNFNNDISFVACLLAKQYLEKHFGVTDFDAASKPQGANGLDIDVATPNGERVVAEIKTIVPYKAANKDFGSAQKKSFRADFEKLNKTKALHKLLFVTDSMTYDLVQRKYTKEIPGVQVVLLVAYSQ